MQSAPRTGSRLKREPIDEAAYRSLHSRKAASAALFVCWACQIPRNSWSGCMSNACASGLILWRDIRCRPASILDEREAISERTKAALAAAKVRGKRLGTPESSRRSGAHAHGPQGAGGPICCQCNR